MATRVVRVILKKVKFVYSIGLIGSDVARPVYLHRQARTSASRKCNAEEKMA